MPLFDPDTVPTECGKPEYVVATNFVIDQIRALKVASLCVAGDVRTANLTRCFIQAHIRRSLEFVEAAYAEFKAGRLLASKACARANYENVAMFCDFAKQLIPVIDSGDHAQIRAFVEDRAFATRNPDLIEAHGDGIKAVNVLTQIDKMTALYEEYRSAYDHLSDFVHPNGMGGVVHFLTIDRHAGVATFEDSGKNAHWALSSAISSAFMLVYMWKAIAQIEEHLSKLT
jgi:hypothetical protein